MADLKTRGGAELERDPEDLERIKVMIRKMRRSNFLFQLVAELVSAPATATVQPFMFRAALNSEEGHLSQESKDTGASDLVAHKERPGALYPDNITPSSVPKPLVSWERWAVPATIQIVKSTFEYSLTSILLWLQPQIEDNLAQEILMLMRSGTAPAIVPVVHLPPVQAFAVQLTSAVLFYKLEQASFFISTRDESENRSVFDLWSNIGFSSMALVLSAFQGFHSPIYVPWATFLLADYIDGYDPITLVNKSDITSRAGTFFKQRNLTTFMRGSKAFLKVYFTPSVFAYTLAAGVIKNVGQMASYLNYLNTLQTIQSP